MISLRAVVLVALVFALSPIAWVLLPQLFVLALTQLPLAAVPLGALGALVYWLVRAPDGAPESLLGKSK